MTRAHATLTVAVVVLATLSSATTRAKRQPGAIPFEINALLDAYAKGDRDQAMAVVARSARPHAQALRTMLVATGHGWAHAVQSDLRHRLLVAAAFGLEFEATRVEHGDWTAVSMGPCSGRCTIEWACTVLRARGATDDAERRWFAASFALIAGVRDWTFVYAPLTPPTARTRITGHVTHALARFPDDPRFRLTRAMAIASRYDLTDELDAPRDGERTGPVRSSAAVPLILIRGDGDGAALPRVAEQRLQQIEFAKRQMADLVSDLQIGGEAQLRLSYIHWRLGEYDLAIAAARQAIAVATTTADQRYVALMVAAQSAQAAGTFDDADAYYREALALRPESQSATIGLAALRFFRGDAATAYDLVERNRTQRPRDDDPWRLFLYGEYPRLPELIQQLRSAVSR